LAQTKARKVETEQITRVPKHVAFIMDGNGRWAAKRGLPRLAGHRAGTENLRRIIRACVEFGIQYMTIYAFSTENWGRPKEEVAGLLHILEDVIDRELAELHQEGVQLRHIGHLEKLPEMLREKVLKAIEVTQNNQRLVLCLAFNYGGRDEIVCAIKDIIQAGIPAEEISPEIVGEHLFTAGIPDPDLIVRTSGEMRVSNFLIWQGAYSEWYITPTFWPDFDREEFYKILVDYSNRDRRYGRISQECMDYQ
jgi:undecaprenyl diphosphate synthase